MANVCDVLILDDGELDDLARVLGGLDVAFTRLRGGEIGEDLPPPRELLVATPRRAAAVRKGAARDARPARPVRIIAVQEDSNAMRRMLRRQGFDLLVRRPTHPEVWRLLIRRALYQGGERRSRARHPVFADVTITVRTDRGSQSAQLVELSSRACRIVSEQPFQPGERALIELPPAPGRGEPLCLEGEVLRAESEPPVGGSPRFLSAVLFDAEVEAASRESLAALLATWSDAAHEGAGAERRRHARGAFESRVSADREGDALVLMGRDLSAGGMRVERIPDLAVGDCFQLSIFAPGSDAPLRLTARVIRDDAEQGFALAFQDVPSEVGAELEKLVACLPDVEPLQASEVEGLGSVISELRPVSGEPG